MTRRLPVLGMAVLIVCLSAPVTHAQQDTMKKPEEGFRAELLFDLGTLEEKLVGLAGALSQDQYTWRPGDGVRSCSEVFMHVASTNYMLATIVGVQTPEGTNPRGFEQNSNKQTVIEILKASFAHIRGAIMGTSDADLNRTTRLFGRDATWREVFMLAQTHSHEHLGQSIAYARMNGVTPPWSGGGSE